MKKELETNKTKIERLQLEGQYEKASKLLYVEVPKLEIKINELETKITSQASNFRDSVTSNEVAEVISKATGIKITKLLESEKVKILNLSNDLKFRVKGQDEAIKVVSDTVLRSKAGINDPKRPIGTFLFLGPTGVGKTELAKALSYNMFDSEKTMIRIDCSELMEEHSISKLIGSPAGYIGYGDANILAEPVRRRPYSIVLFDEIEKAHPKVLTILLQILDEGVLHDSQGNNVNFKNTIIIMTSNIGSVEIFEGKKKEAIESLKKYLRPEFINRIDEIVTFTPISKTAVKEIVLKMLDELSQRLSKEGYDIKMDDKRLIDFIIEESFDENFGARPIKRFIQKTIENYLANQILLNNVKKNHPYAISVNSKKEITTKVISID
jgi:ATP-dependent Clp protease ATP-binding subunit ClpB